MYVCKNGKSVVETKQGSEKYISGILKATSNGLREQSIARRAEIKVSCISNTLPSVLLCRTLKPNGKFSGNLWVQQRQKTNRTP